MQIAIRRWVWSDGFPRLLSRKLFVAYYRIRRAASALNLGQTLAATGLHLYAVVTSLA